MESVLQAVWLNIGQTLQWVPPYYRDCGSSPKSSSKLPTGQLSSWSGTWEWFNWVLRNVAGFHVYTYLAVSYSMILFTFAEPSLVRHKQDNIRSISSLNTSCGVPHFHKRGCGMGQVFTVVLVSLLRNITPCTFVSRHQSLLWFAALKMEVRSSSEAFVSAYLSNMCRVPGDGNYRSSVATGPALDSQKFK